MPATYAPVVPFCLHDYVALAADLNRSFFSNFPD